MLRWRRRQPRARMIRLVEETGQRAADLLPRVPEAVRQELVPAVAQTARTIGEEVTPALAQAVGTVSGLAATGRQQAADAAGSVGRLGRRGRRARRLAASAGRAAALGVATRGRKRVQRATDRATRRAGAFLGDSFGALGWLAVAATLIYFGYLNPEQRARLLGGIKTAFEQATELYRDFQGYTGEMEP